MRATQSTISMLQSHSASQYLCAKKAWPGLHMYAEKEPMHALLACIWLCACNASVLGRTWQCDSFGCLLCLLARHLEATEQGI